MDMTIWIVVGVVLVAIAGLVIFYRRRQEKMFQEFEQLEAMMKQVPAQKKQSFILFMFREGARHGKDASAKIQSKVNDPKYIELQLLQMSTILKDRSRVKDKKLKQALQMYDAYLIWEKSPKRKSGKVA